MTDIRKRVGIVFQNPDNQTVASIVEDDIAFGAENVGLPREEIGERIAFALQAVGMEEYRNSMVSRLSGGQKQRVAIAGVLALKPDVMILDESTAITHFMEEALLADRAIVMNRGEIVMQGAPSDIFERHEELLTYNLTLPQIGYICKRLQEGGFAVPDTLDVEELAREVAKCVS